MAKKSVAEGQGEIPGTQEAAPAERPQVVRGDLMLAEFVKPHYTKDKEGQRFVELEFSFGLTREHAGKIPPQVEDAWKFIKRGINKTMGSIEIDPHVVAVHLAPDEKPEVSLLFASITHGALATIEEKGSGEAKDVIRFSFRVRTEVEGNVCEFADNQFGTAVWIRMQEAQGRLKEQA